MKIKVYLNESRDSFRGFDYKNARLREAAEFDLDAELPRLNLSEAGSLEAFEAFQKTKEDAALARRGRPDGVCRRGGGLSGCHIMGTSGPHPRHER